MRVGKPSRELSRTLAETGVRCQVTQEISPGESGRINFAMNQSTMKNRKVEKSRLMPDPQTSSTLSHRGRRQRLDIGRYVHNHGTIGLERALNRRSELCGLFHSDSERTTVR